MLRLIIILIFLILFWIASLFLWLFELILEKVNMDLRNKTSLAIVNWAFRVVLFLAGTEVTVSGYEKVPKDEPVLFVSNHLSYFDIVVGYTLAPGLMGFVAKKAIGKVPLLKVWMRFVNCLFVDREDSADGKRLITDAINHIKSGISIWICPEGTRSKTGELAEFKGGGFLIAQRAGCRIVPVGFKNTADIFERHIPLVKKAHVYVNFGDPIEVGKLSRDERKALAQTTHDIVAELIK